MSPQLASSSLRAFAAIGSGGRHESNMRRDLISVLGDPHMMEPTYVDVVQNVLKPTIENPDSSYVMSAHFPLLLPHEQFAHLYKFYPERFRFLFTDGKEPSEVLPICWSTVQERRDPRLRYHPICTHANWRSRCIPPCLHGDVVPVAAVGKGNATSFDVCSFQGLARCAESQS